MFLRVKAGALTSRTNKIQIFGKPDLRAGSTAAFGNPATSADSGDAGDADDAGDAGDTADGQIADFGFTRFFSLPSFPEIRQSSLSILQSNNLSINLQILRQSVSPAICQSSICQSFSSAICQSIRQSSVNPSDNSTTLQLCSGTTSLQRLYNSTTPQLRSGSTTVQRLYNSTTLQWLYNAAAAL